MFGEWLEVTGDGGFASSMYSGEQRRRYHSYFIGAKQGADESRFSLLARVDEVLRLGSSVYELSKRVFRNGTQPDGSGLIGSVKYLPCPRISFNIPWPGYGTVTLHKEITAAHKTRGIVVSYELEGDALEAIPQSSFSQCSLELELFFACSPYHQLPRERNEFRCVTDRVQGDTYKFSIHCDSDYELHMQAPSTSTFLEGGEWYKDFYFQTEEERGYDFTGDLFRAGRILFPLSLNEKSGLHFTSSAESVGTLPLDVQREELERRESLLPRSGRSFHSELMLAADKFLVRAADGSSQIVAGYPWFVSWGRDTMISLPGICLVTGRFEEAKGILTHWTTYMKQGLIPNRLSTPAGPPDYNTADATLWYVVSAFRYFQYTRDRKCLAEVFLPAVSEILKWHRKGTLYGIRVDSDGLLLAGTADTQLTWMDAMYDGVPVTPRYGKAVDINALWINVLFIASFFHSEYGDKSEARRLYQEAQRAHTRFVQLFWRSALGYFADCVTSDESDDSEVSYDISLRPNQLLALSLPVSLASMEQGGQVLESVRSHLLTPVGLRTLAPFDPSYRGVYAGELCERDEAYHQGTVWPYLVGGYLSALKRFESPSVFAAEASSIFNGFERELASRDVPGSLNEIYDGDLPHAPRGAYAQAWSIAEVLRAYVEDYLEAGANTALDLSSYSPS